MIIQHKPYEEGIQMILTIQSKKNKEETWQVFGSPEGLQSWFPQLKLVKEGDIPQLTFEMEDFKEDIPVLDWQEGSSWTWAWDKAKVSLILKEHSLGTSVQLVEWMPKDFGGGQAHRKQDMAGWASHMDRLEKWLRGRESKDLSQLVKRWESFMDTVLVEEA